MSQQDPYEEPTLRRRLREHEARKRQQAQASPPPQPPGVPDTRPSPPPSKGGRKRPASRAVGFYLPWWGIVIAVGVLGLATCGLWTFIISTTPDVSGEGLFAGLTPTFLVITNTPTPGQPEPLGPTPTPVPEYVTPTPAPAVEEPPADEPEVIQPIEIGSQITIFGTEGDGLAIRQGPSLSYASPEKPDGSRLIGFDGEVFLVEDGPRENDGYTWWYITDPNDPDRFGWAAADFMLRVPTPDPGPLQEVTPTPGDDSEAEDSGST